MWNRQVKILDNQDFVVECDGFVAVLMYYYIEDDIVVFDIFNNQDCYNLPADGKNWIDLV